MSSDIPTITAFTRNDFRKWLRAHHKKESKVAVIIHKKHTGKPFPSHRELLEEAICFGWVDTTIKRIDEDTFVRHFSKRTKNSRWSDNTQRYARDLIKQNKMAPQGMMFYELGLKKPNHDHGIPKNPDMPVELKEALARNAKAHAGFETFSPSARRTLYRWLLRAKLPPTRAKRVAQIVQSAIAKNKNVLQPTTKANT